MGVYLFTGQEVTAESLLDFAPEEPLFAALFLVALYAFKSLTVVFPILVLNVLGGFLFEPVPALVVNTVGVLVELSIPYWIGRASGTNYVERLYEKHPKIRTFIQDADGSDLFLSFFLRIISCLPGDAVSMCLGAGKMPFGTFLLGSFLGTIPGTIAATVLGTSITDPASPMFWVSIGLTVGLSVLSFVLYLLWRRRSQK